MSSLPFPPHNGTDTSREAAESMVTPAATLRGMVFEHVLRNGQRGATCDEAEQALGLPHQTCSARFNELHRQGLIVATDRRPTRSGRKAKVYVARKGVQDD